MVVFKSIVWRIVNNPLNGTDPFTFSGMNPNPSFSKTKDGPIYRVSFEIEQDVWQQFVEANTKGMIVDFCGQVAESHQSMESMGEKPKGGPVSKNAGMLSDEPEANAFAKAQGYDDFKTMIYHACGIDSRARLDHDDEARNKYEALKHRYFRWAAR